MDRIALAVELTPQQVRPLVYRVISKKHGLNLKSSALEAFAEHIGHRFGTDWRGAKSEKFLDEFAKVWKDEDRGLFVEGEAVHSVIRELENTAASQQNVATRTETLGKADQQSFLGPKLAKFHWRDYFKVVGAQQMRNLSYNHALRHFEIAPQGKVLGDSQALIRMFPSRYYILHDRITRSEIFSSPDRSLTAIQNMVGRSNCHFYVFGLLSRLEGASGDMWLVDMTGRVKLDFIPQLTVAPDHYYCEGSFAVCEGYYLDDGRFRVVTIGPPPPETRQETQETYGNIDFCGLISSSKTRIERLDPQFVKVMVQEEQRNTHHRIVVLGCDLFLDKPDVLDGLQYLLQKLDEAPPVALVLCGSFCSVPFQAAQDSIAKYTEYINGLALMFKKAPRLSKETKVIIVPGENDPWHSTNLANGPSVWPLQPLPELFTRRLQLAVKDVELTSNPTRLCYLSQEIVICREGYGQRFRKYAMSLSKPKEHKQVDDAEELADTIEDIDLDADVADRQLALNDLAAEPMPKPSARDQQSRKLVATLLDQAHLSPFPLMTRPIAWEFEHALSLTQWPSVLITADSTIARFAINYEGCLVANPGRFIQANSVRWIEYTPHNSSGTLMSQDLN